MGTSSVASGAGLQPIANIEVVVPGEHQLPEVLTLWKEFIDLHGQFDPYYRRRDDCEGPMVDFFHRCMDEEDLLLLVALERAKVIGYMIGEVVMRPPIFVTSKYGAVIDLAIKEGHRRKGVGERLLNETLRWFRGKGVERIELKVLIGNPMAESFWNKQGCKEHVRIMYLDLERR